MAIFEGAGVAIITPFDENKNVNYDKLKEIIDFQIDNGTDSIIIAGTTGEAATLTESEHLDVIEAAVKYVNKRVPVIAGTGSNCTRTAVYLSQEAEKRGADALLVVTPYYNKTSQQGLINHYTKIAEAVNVPIIMYNVPSRTGCNIAPETAAYLAKNVKNIVGMKDAVGNIGQTVKMMKLAEGSLELYSGNDDQVIPVLSCGGVGVISVFSNVAPRQCHDMVMEYLHGDRNKALQMQFDALDLMDALFCEVNPIPVKGAMNMLDFQVGGYREPLMEMTKEHQELVRTELMNYGLLK